MTSMCPVGNLERGWEYHSGGKIPNFWKGWATVWPLSQQLSPSFSKPLNGKYSGIGIGLGRSLFSIANLLCRLPVLAAISVVTQKWILQRINYNVFHLFIRFSCFSSFFFWFFSMQDALLMQVGYNLRPSLIVQRVINNSHAVRSSLLLPVRNTICYKCWHDDRLEINYSKYQSPGPSQQM